MERCPEEIRKDHPSCLVGGTLWGSTSRSSGNFGVRVGVPWARVLVLEVASGVRVGTRLEGFTVK